jgi:hypothetical protein
MLQQQMKEITNIFRRVYRIYAHAWFQHRDMFWRVEESTGLYIFFKTVCDEYGMIQPENYTIPPEAEGRAPDGEEEAVVQERVAVPMILRPESPGKASDMAGKGLSRGDTTKRHTRVPSNLAPLATVIQEEAEDEDETKPTLDRNITAITVEDAERLQRMADEQMSKKVTEEFPEFKIETSNAGLKREADKVQPETTVEEATPVETKSEPEPVDDEEEEDDVTVLEDEPSASTTPMDAEVKVEAAELDEAELATETAAAPTAAAADPSEAGKSVAD